MSDVMILGSDAWDFHAGEYFHPRSRGGMILSRILKLAGKERSEFAFGDIRDVAQVKPKCILALGDAALFDITGMGGRKQGVDDLRGYVLRSWDDFGNVKGISGLPVVCSYSPESLMGRTKLWGVLAHDLLRACEVAQKGAPVEEEVHYKVAPTEQEALALLGWCKEHPDSIISCDIENPSSAKGEDESELRFDHSRIEQIQFTVAPYTGYAFPWQEPFITISKEILALPNPKVGHNWWEFDLTHLEAHGCEVRGAQHDTMWMFHVLQPDLPKSLQYVTSFFEKDASPWKHTISQNLARYGCIDSDMTYRIYYSLLKELRARSVAHAYHAHTFRLQWEVLDQMKRRGIYVNREAQKELKEKLEREIERVDGELQKLIPVELLNCQPKSGYKRCPKEVKVVIATFEPEVVQLFSDTMPSEIGTPEFMFVGTPFEERESQINNVGYIRRKFDSEWRWCKLLPFLASSPQQLKRYMQHRGHEIPKAIGNDDKESTGKKQLQQLYKKTGDEVYRIILELRALQKIEGTYIWPLGDDSCIHPTVRAYGTASGQMSAHSPNCQNIGKGREIDTAVRNTIQARPGRRLVSIDLKGFHAVMLGFLAGDPTYIRAAKIDIHSYVTGAFLRNKLQSVKRLVDPVDFPGVRESELEMMRQAEGELKERLQGYDKWLELSDIDLSEMLGWIKKHYKFTRDKKIKNACHGIQFGLQAKKLYQMYIENFKSQGEAKQILDIVKSTFPKVFEFQEKQVWKAHNEVWLQNPYGYRRAFYEAKRWDSTRGWVNGENAEDAKAFGPSSTAHGYFKEAILRCAERGWMDKYSLSNLVHDECDFDCPSNLVDECIENVSTELEKPSPYLTHPVIAPLGFSVETDASVGRAWGEMVDYRRVGVGV